MSLTFGDNLVAQVLVELKECQRCACPTCSAPCPNCLDNHPNNNKKDGDDDDDDDHKVVFAVGLVDNPNQQEFGGGGGRSSGVDDQREILGASMRSIEMCQPSSGCLCFWSFGCCFYFLIGLFFASLIWMLVNEGTKP
jgi:hypothetical protein